MTRTSFLDKFSVGSEREARDSLRHVMRNVQAMLNTKEGYGFFLRGFGLGGYVEKSGTGRLAEALAGEIEEHTRQHEPRLKDVAVKLRGRDSALWLRFELSARLDDKPCRLHILFDTTTGQVRIEAEEDR